MLIQKAPPVHLTYCMNVHPGESLADVVAALHTYPAQVRDAVAPGRRFGLGLRLGARAIAELTASARRLAEIREFLDAENFYVFTLNGFPYGPFHGTPVKEAVYRPDWTTRERRDYTLRLARFLAEILPPGESGGISTVPLSYRAWGDGPDRTKAMIAHLAETALELEKISRESGHDLHLGLEPEPGCLLETTEETIRFFHDKLFSEGARTAARRAGCPRNVAEAVLRRRIGVCLDTCHAALQFETPAESLAALLASGIRISKIQLSAALSVHPARGQSLARVRAEFPDEVYLHQVRGQTAAGGLVSADDLPEPPEPGPLPVREWRIHFHVPLHFPGNTAVGSTAGLIDRDFLRAAMAGGGTHLEIETYTFHVLPASLRRSGWIDSMAGDYAWIRARIPASPYNTK